MQLQDTSVLILGLGQSGLAMARWCARHGARVTVADTREAPPQLAELQREWPDARFVAGELGASLVDGQAHRAVFVSPGLAPAQTQAVLDAARAIGLWVTGELGLFAAALADLQRSQAYAPRVLGVTGTNGKTTVTSLTAQLVASHGTSVVAAGNIGPTLMDTLQASLDAGSLPEVWVLELSSFQLELASGFEPTAATVLNVTQDHLDWHGSMAAYAQAKSHIFGQQGLMVLNRDDDEVMQMYVAANSNLQTAADAYSGKKKATKEAPERARVSFGAGAPQRPGDYGLESTAGMTWLVRAQEADETQRRRKGDDEELHIQRLMPADALRIRGRHNAVNALAALALAHAAGVPIAPMLYALREYRGEPHRVESVAIVNDVEYFDDSKGTNVGATVAALNGLGVDRGIVVILGGDGKGQDFAPLVSPVAQYAKAVLLIGRDAPVIEAALQPAQVPLIHARDLPDAVQRAARLAKVGDAVLLSPACASWDMFDGYAHRAQVFCDAVQALAEGALDEEVP
ncbi:UDP-N-acetylmuramoyl-L-alanine--D-glutamate ligase [Comamonas serinivorans]|uniref:UDP-N-acetylmuramoylalanine--D-glutamate ligase n=1 Tax=Comamonas serinivorans TaxID=1082851 RepID=A0A1Y0ERM1_9BURK|nr:UDP-N-acetylmuramoyl-L-alanine--D-glutamate ligase [Comamonas serinivorans]ARU06243.1 UDP-N-acetylmuramoyl-L-alanine--D-glutamate ligase [Comamonas serinivorans]